MLCLILGGLEFVTVGTNKCSRKALGPGVGGAYSEAEGLLETEWSSLLLWPRAISASSA